jgi:hypothetical protein
MLPTFMHLSLSTGYVLASLSACPAMPAPDVTLDFQNERPTISHTRSSSYLMNMNSSSPKYGGEFPIMEGLTDSDIRIEYKTNFTGTGVSHDRLCVVVKSVDITVTYKPTVYISSNIPPATCRFDVTLQHEMKHVNAGINTINEFIPDIKLAAAQAAQDAQTVNPVSENNIDSIRDNIGEQLEQAINEQNDGLEKILHTRQRKIDSRFEYIRVSHACPGEERQ